MKHPISPGFGFLCWNIQKRSLTEEFRREFQHLLKHYPSDIIALQEVKLPESGIPVHFRPFSRALSCNFVRDRHHYGVMTLSKLPLTSHSPFTTQVREAVVATRKSALLSRHILPGGETLALLNLHAINFVPHRLFSRELARISEWIGHIRERRCIVAGDFNTWSKKRQISLDGVMRKHALERLVPENETSIKSILGMPLDHIYYRGLAPCAASVIDTPISDHNPIYARFSDG